MDANTPGMCVRLLSLLLVLFSLSKRSFAKRNLRAKLWIDIRPFYTEEFRKSEEAHKEAYRIEWHRIHDSSIQEEKEKHEKHEEQDKKKHEEQDKKLSVQKMNRQEHKNKLRDRQRLIEETEKSKAEEAAKSKAKKETKKKKNQEEGEKRKKAQEASNKKKHEEQDKKLSVQKMNRQEHKNKLRDRQRLIEETEKSKAEEAAKSKAKKETKKKKNQEEGEKRKKAQEASNKKTQEEGEKRKKAQEATNKKTQEEGEKKKYASEQAEKALIRAKEQDDKRMKEESEKRKKAAERKAAIEAKKRRDLFGIMVISRRDDVKRRNIIRETWGNYSKDTPIYFMVGTHCPYKPWHRKPNSCTPISEDIVISKRYVSEQEARTERLQQEDHVVVLDAVHVDDQRAKMMYLGYEWMYKHVRKRYTLKTEEAYDVDVGSLHEWLYNHSKNSYYNEIFAESFDRANAEEPQGAHLIISKYVLKRLFKSKAAFDGMTFNGIIRQKFVLIGRIILSGQYFSKA